MKKLVAMLLVMALVLPMAVSGLEKVEVGSDEYSQVIVNQDKVIEMLIDSGKIKKGASQGEIMKALNAFVKNKSKKFNEPGALARFEAKRTAALYDKVDQFSKKGKPSDPVTEEPSSSVVEVDTFTGTVQEDRVMAILINFQDYDGSTLTAEHTDMYYDTYAVDHYRDLLFGDSYTGPSGQNFISMKSYYEEQSGGAYTVTGDVFGWYTAKYDAAYYGGNDASDNDSAPQALVKEALDALVLAGVDLSYFDQEDRYDLDGDGNYREPDGMIDHIMIFHASVGEEAGGGELAADAIWSHRWNLGDPYDMGIETGLTQEGHFANYTAYDYTIQPIDAAAGVCAHEYGHDLGLPDEYDTQYTSEAGEPVSYWSIMSSGSWAGAIGGTEPTGFSPYAKHFFAATMNEHWLKAAEVNFEDLQAGSQTFVLDEASTKGMNFDAVKINMPPILEEIVKPKDNNGHYYSTMGNNLDVKMEAQVTVPSGRRVSLTMDAFYQIEKDWDYAYVYVKDAQGNVTHLSNRNTTSTDPNQVNLGNGITGSTRRWTSLSFDMSAYVGQTVTIGVRYVTDGAVAEYGICVDNIKLVNGRKIEFIDANQSEFDVTGFVKDGDGTKATERYYLAEWRSHNGVDQGLAHIKRGDSFMAFEEGMVLWFVDESYEDNHVGNHPGYGYLGVVDASQEQLTWTDGTIASTKYLIHDAAFSMTNTAPMFLDYSAYYGTTMTLTDNTVAPVPTFHDKNDYSTPFQPESGKQLPVYGLKIEVINESADQSMGTIRISVE